MELGSYWSGEGGDQRVLETVDSKGALCTRTVGGGKRMQKTIFFSLNLIIYDYFDFEHLTELG